MQPDFWHERWRSGQIGFHRPTTHESLMALWGRLPPPVGGRVFVPLCGKSVDLLWLRAQGHEVVGVELSDIALQAFCQEHGVAARRRTVGAFDCYEAPQLALWRGDFFALTPEMLAGVGAVYDRAALISWAPALRAAYVQQLTRLTPPGTRTLLLTLEYPPAQISGPPFSVTAAEVAALYSAHHRIEELSRRDILDTDPRMRERGVTELLEVAYRLTRI